MHRLLAARYGDKDLVEVAGNDLFLGPGDKKLPVGIVDEVTRSILLPAAGFATLRTGDGLSGQTAAILSYGDFSSSHDHTDALNLGLFGKGHELAADLGYTHTYLRYSWSATTASHNTVLIDGGLQQPGRGNLIFFCPDQDATPSLQVVEAAVPRAYPSAKQYSRCISLVAPRPGSSYVVDFFRVEGGHQHDFMFHGPATHKQEKLAVEAVKLKPQQDTLAGENVPYAGDRQGTSSQYETKNWYSYITDVHSGPITNEAHCRWEYNDGSGIGLRGTFLPDPRAELFTGTAPNLRLDDGKESNYRDAKAIDSNRMPIICIRRTASADETLHSTFVSVFEPYRGQPRIDNVRRLDLGHGIVGVMVSSDGATQYVFNGSDGHGGRLGQGEANGIRFSGQFGAVSQKADDIEMLCLIGGGELSGPAWQIQQSENLVAGVEAFHGDLTGEKENVLVLGADAPPIPNAFGGRIATLRHRDGTNSSYTIAEVRAAGNRTTLKLADPATFLLSRFAVDAVNGNTLRTPHPLRKAGDGWFLGKWLTCAGKTYRIMSIRSDGRENIYCRGFLVDVEPEGGQVEIKPGDKCIVHAVRPGDKVVLTQHTLVRKEAPNSYSVVTTATKLTLALPASEGQKRYRYRDENGVTQVVSGRQLRTHQGRSLLVVELDAGRIRGGRTSVELAK